MARWASHRTDGRGEGDGVGRYPDGTGQALVGPRWGESPGELSEAVKKRDGILVKSFQHSSQTRAKLLLPPVDFETRLTL